VCVRKILEVQLDLARMARIPLQDSNYLTVPERDLLVDIYNERASEEEETHKKQMRDAGVNNLTGYAQFGH